MKTQTYSPSALASSRDASVNALNVVHWELPLSSLSVFDGVDFEDYVAIDDMLVTCFELRLVVQ